MDLSVIEYVTTSLSNLNYKYNLSNIKFLLDFSYLLISIFYDYITLNPSYISSSEFYDYMIDDIFEYLEIYFLDDNGMLHFISQNKSIFFQSLNDLYDH